MQKKLYTLLKNSSLTLFFALFIHLIYGQNVNEQLGWIKNTGQFGENVSYVSRTALADVIITRDAEIYYRLKPENPVVIKESFYNASKPVFKEKHSTGIKLNYLKGKKAFTSVPGYYQIELPDIWDGIDVQLKYSKGNVEKIIKAGKGAIIDDALFILENADDICIDGEGELVVEAKGNEIYFTAPVAWQEAGDKKIPVEVAYEIKDFHGKKAYGFILGEYDPAYPVYIDPLLGSTYFGGSGQDIIKSVLADKDDNVYIAGITTSPDLPVDTNSYNGVYSDTFDIFVAKFDSGLNQLLACTYIGGAGNDVVSDMHIDQHGNVYIAGSTTSGDYPVTANALDTLYTGDGAMDMIITCLDPDLTEVKYSTYTGFKKDDWLTAFAIDNDNNLIFTGYSESGIPSQGVQFYNDTKQFVFFKLDSTLSTIYASNSIQTYGSSVPSDIVIDNAQNVFICGITDAKDFPVTPDAVFDTLQGKSDGFIIRLNNDLDALLASTYFGAKDIDWVESMALGEENNVYVTGGTFSRDFPVLTGDYDIQINNGNDGANDAYVSILDSNLTHILAGTYIGGTANDYATAILLDTSDNVFVSGITYSADFPVFCTSYQNVRKGITDGFVIKMSKKLDNLNSSTLVGGKKFDICSSIAFDTAYNLLIAGFSEAGFLRMNYGYDTVFNNSPKQGFVLKLAQDLNSGIPCCPKIISPEPFSTVQTRIVGFKWEEVPGAEGYLLSIGGSKDTFDLVNRLDVPSNGYMIDQFDCGDTVFIQIIAYNQYGESENCDTVWFKIRDPFLEITEEYICPGDSMLWRGNYYDSAGIYYEKYYDSDDCDSTYQLNLYEYPVYDTVISKSICDNDSLYWEGEYYDSTGYYTKVFHSVNGCDSTVHLDLTVFPSYYFEEKDTICSDEVLWWHGQELTTAGTYIAPYTTVNGCDSTYVMNLTVNPVYYHEIIEIICEGDVYEWEGQELTVAGTYTANYTSIYGCDSIEALHLEVNPSYYFVESDTICQGDTLFWQGQVLTEEGSYSASYSTMEGCDSSYTMSLAVFPSYGFTEIDSICDGDTLLWRGQQLTQAGTYYAGYTTVNGCDSVYTLYLNTYPSYHFYDTTSICQGDTLTWQGQSLTETGEYRATYSTVNGCDSIYTLYFTVNPVYSYYETDTICQSDTLYWHGDTLTAAGGYEALFNTVAGCDSNYYLQLEVLPEYYYYDTVTLCQDEQVVWQGDTISSGGVYEVAYTTAGGCDSVYNLVVEEIIIDTSLTFNNDTLFAVYTEDASYQWVLCPQYEIIDSAEQYYYAPPQSGDYAVIITSNGCVDTSACMHVDITATGDFAIENNIRVYPNPAAFSSVTVEIDNYGQAKAINIYDLHGREVFRKTEDIKRLNSIDISGFVNGVYFVKVTCKDFATIKKIVVGR